MNFGKYIEKVHQSGGLVVQPRMGFSRLDKMQEGLLAVRDAHANTVGTITLDSYTRVGDLAGAAKALRSGHDLNGFPIVSYGHIKTREMLNGLQSPNFPIQVRHGSAKPEHIFSAILDCEIDATEGGPVSYCLPYGRTPLREAIGSWRRCADLAARSYVNGHGLHIETFGGCMLGQLCPPSMLIAISLLEGMFFSQRGVKSISLSYAQQTCFIQDIAAVKVLRRLSEKWLKDVDWHVVLYTYMGVFPRSSKGAQNLLCSSVDIARMGGAERLIVKTVAEAHRIPTVVENISAIELAEQHWQKNSAYTMIDSESYQVHFDLILKEASLLVEAVLEQHEDIGEALRRAFAIGYLDIPYCLHRDNAGLARAYVDIDQSLQWLRTGNLPIASRGNSNKLPPMNPNDFLQMLSTVEKRFDGPHLNSKTDSALHSISA